MIRLNITAVFYSNKNIDLAYKTKKICRGLQINVINATDFIDLTMKIMEVKPQIVFFDLNTIKLDSHTFQLLKSKEQYFATNAILIYSKNEQIEEYQDIDVVCVKEEELEAFLSGEEQLYKLNAVLSEQENRFTNFPSGQINDHLFKMGFSAKHMGYSFLMEAIKLIMKKGGSVGSLNSEIYPLIAAKYGTVISNVERGIRNAILCAYNTCIQIDLENCEFCNLFNFFKSRPTNREFICLYIEKMLEEPKAQKIYNKM